jgi:hypothetical protein
VNLFEQIEQLIREFPYDNYGIDIDATDKNHEWPKELTGQLTALLAAEINRAVLNWDGAEQ